MTGTHIGSERWLVYFFRRHSADDSNEAIPGRDFLDACPTKVRATMLAVVSAVADAPPPKFSGGGCWKVVRDEMAGFYKVRVNGPQRKHFRLFCVLERHGGDVGFGAPAIIVIAGKEKPFRTEFMATDYRRVRRLGEEYQKRTLRSVAQDGTLSAVLSPVSCVVGVTVISKDLEGRVNEFDGGCC